MKIRITGIHESDAWYNEVLEESCEIIGYAYEIENSVYGFKALEFEVDYTECKPTWGYSCFYAVTFEKIEE